MVQVHLSQNTFSLASQLKSQQLVGEMTDTLIICGDGESVFAHCAVLATHWVWAYLVRGLEWRGDRLVIIMDKYTKIEVEKWISEAYANIDNNDQLDLQTNVMDILNTDNIKDENDDDTDFKDLKYSNIEHPDELVHENADIDDSLVNVGEYFDLENLVMQQILLKKKEETPVDLDLLRSKLMKDELFKSCLNALEMKFESFTSKVRGLPLQGFVFTDVGVLQTAESHVKQEKVERKSGDGKVSIVRTYSCNFTEECEYMSEEKKYSTTMHVMDCHMNHGAFKCKDCGNRFTLKDRAFGHIKRTHVEKKIKIIIKENFTIDLTCNLCGQVYAHLESLKTHIKNVHEKQTDVKCPECDFVSKDYIEVRKHRRDEHKFGHRACHICGKQFSSQVGFDHHVENTHGSGSFPCEDCGDIFKTLRALNDHRTRKHLERKYVCDECGAKFHTPFEVKKHKRCHGTEYPFQCTLCDKKCREAGQLKRHMYKHTGERPYECKQCEATFNQSSSLKRHTVVVHSGIRQFQCELCDFKGGQAYDLVRHMNAVHATNTSANV